MEILLSRADVVSLLRQRQGTRSTAQLAREWGMARSLLSEVYRGTRQPSDAVLARLGLEKRTVYVKARAARRKEPRPEKGARSSIG